MLKPSPFTLIKLWCQRYPFLAASFILLFIAFPLRLLSPHSVEGGVKQAFAFRLPELALAAYLGLAELTRQHHRHSLPFLAWLPGLALLPALPFWLVGDYAHWGEMLGGLGFVCIIPLAWQLPARQHGHITARVCAMGFSLLWLIQIIHFYINKYPVGLSGNINWFSHAVLATAIFALSFCWKLRLPFVARVVLCLPVICTTAHVIYKTGCRASLVALAILPLLFLLKKCPDQQRPKLAWSLLGLGILALIILINFPPQKVQQIWALDARSEFWPACVDMLGHHPMGVGPGRFRDLMPAFDSLGHRLHVNHPHTMTHAHNTLLQIALEYGLPAMLAWLMLCLAALKVFFGRHFNQRRLRPLQPALFALALLLIQTLFDKSMSMPPVALMLPMTLGLSLGAILPRHHFRLQLENSPRILHFAPLILLFPLLYLAIRETGSTTWHRRQAKIAVEHHEKIPHLLRALEASPNNPEFRGELAHEMLFMGEFKSSLSQAQRAAQIAPGFGSADQSAVHALLQLKRTEKNLEHLVHAGFYLGRTIHHNPESFLHRIDLLRLFAAYPSQLSANQKAILNFNLKIQQEITLKNEQIAGIRPAANMADAALTMNELLQWKCANWLPLKSVNLKQELQQWQAETEYRLLYQQATRLLQTIEFSDKDPASADPLFQSPADYLTAGSNMFDTQHIHVCRTLNNRKGSLEQRLLQESKKFDAETKAFHFPLGALKVNTLNGHSLAQLAWLQIYLAGKTPLIISDEKGQPQGIVWADISLHELIDLAAKNKLSQSKISWRGFRFAEGKILDADKILQPQDLLLIHFPPQWMALRNAMLSEMLHSAGNPRFAEIPSAANYALRQLINKTPLLQKQRRAFYKLPQNEFFRRVKGE